MMNSKYLLILASSLALAGGAPAQAPYDQLLPDEPFGLLWAPDINGVPQSIMAWGAIGNPGADVAARYANEDFLVNGLSIAWPLPNPYSLSGPTSDAFGIGTMPIGPTGDITVPVAFFPGWELHGHVWTTVWEAGFAPEFRSVQMCAKYERVTDINGVEYDFITTLTYSRSAQDLILRADYPAAVPGANATTARVKVNGAIVGTGTVNANGQLNLVLANQNLITGTLVEVEIVDGVVAAGATIVSETIR